MRQDEEGNEVPGTLGEYRVLCAAIGGDNCQAVAFLDKRIASAGRDGKVIVPDSQIRVLLMPMLAQEADPK